MKIELGQKDVAVLLNIFEVIDSLDVEAIKDRISLAKHKTEMRDEIYYSSPAEELNDKYMRLSLAIKRANGLLYPISEVVRKKVYAQKEMTESFLKHINMASDWVTLEEFLEQMNMSKKTYDAKIKNSTVNEKDVSLAYETYLFFAEA